MKNCLLSLIFILVVGCSTDYNEDLGAGYLFVATNRYNHSIIKNNRMIVGSNIIRHEVFDHYVIGYREESVNPDTRVGSSKGYGYFILNLSSEVLFDGLSKEDYLKKIESMGVTNKKVGELIE